MQVRVDGFPVRLKRLGPAWRSSGRVVLFVHGAGLSAESWGNLPRLCASPRHAAGVIDLSGHGGSGGPALPSIDEMAQWLNSVLGGLHLRSPVLVGHSMGALVALHAAGTSQRALGGLVLLGAGLTMPVNPKLIAAAAEDPPRAAAMIARWAFRDGRSAGRNPSPTPMMRMAARRLLAAAAPGVLATDLAACDRYRDGATVAAGTAAPALVLIGSDDRMTPPAAGTALAEGLPNGRAVAIPACGHMPMIEAPRRVHAAISDFLEELPA